MAGVVRDERAIVLQCNCGYGPIHIGNDLPE
jgi:hypothetical protein